MITAAKLINHPLLTDAFGVSKVFETARRLRELELYPAAKTEVSSQQCAILLYCLAACRSVSQVYSVTEKAPSIKDRWGNSFIHDFSKMLEEDRLLFVIKEISISQETGLAYVVLNDQQTVNLYNKKGSVEHDVNHFCTMKANFLIAFAALIGQKAFTNQN